MSKWATITAIVVLILFLPLVFRVIRTVRGGAYLTRGRTYILNTYGIPISPEHDPALDREFVPYMIAAWKRGVQCVAAADAFVRERTSGAPGTRA
jgi:hypothetical protein